MAAYATQADLVALGLPQKALATIGVPAVDAALESASRIIDSYIGSRYDLPLKTWDASVVQATVKVAALTLMQGRGFAPGVVDADNLQRGYDQAIAWCRDVARGLATPSVVDTTDQTKPPVDPQNAPFVRQAPQGSATAPTSSSRRGW
jgi:hypothetical protein